MFRMKAFRAMRGESEMEMVDQVMGGTTGKQQRRREREEEER